MTTKENEIIGRESPECDEVEVIDDIHSKSNQTASFSSNGSGDSGVVLDAAETISSVEVNSQKELIVPKSHNRKYIFSFLQFQLTSLVLVNQLAWSSAARLQFIQNLRLNITEFSTRKLVESIKRVKEGPIFHNTSASEKVNVSLFQLKH